MTRLGFKRLTPAFDAESGLSCSGIGRNTGPLGWNSLGANMRRAGAGMEDEETVVSQLVQTAGADHIVQAYRGHPIRDTASHGGEPSTSGDERPTRVVRRMVLVQPLGRDAWAENTWTSGSVWSCSELAELGRDRVGPSDYSS